jgi:uncharacterized phiE125 gp8 family phage protein
VNALTVEEFKAHARIDAADEDPLYSTVFVPAAIKWCEEQIERAFITQTWQMTFDVFESSIAIIELLRPELISVTSFTYIDTAGDSQTLVEDTDFIKSTSSHKGRLQPVFGLVWPDARRQMDAITITYTAGFGPLATDIPGDIKMAIAMLAAHWNENREAVLTGTISKEIELSVMSLLSHYQVEL